ncbi:type VII secretion protein EccB [Enemella dayhoffiae]|uniref:Type VII secretion protein EccB n=1 Tax=Enemella dayhoffiae TaxID=2016507 RepID=A0A255HB08_9ACTN|nr:type VII secretion protein EccB [Enemella dayhoffiae]OYO25008.1 type VII secretion protein EccB [Enemella dayhoffiae]
MATRKDLLKAHTFIAQRLVSALVDRDPDNPQPPLRRVGTGMFIGVMLGVLILAGFGVVGLIKPGGSKNWQTDNTVVVTSDSGEVLVYLGGKLYPAHNITSAKLASGGGEVKSVKASSLRDFPRERPIGIKLAPTQLPERKALVSYPIRACSVPMPGRDQTRATTLEIGQGAVPDTSTAFVARGDGSTGKEYLVADGTAYEMPNHAVAIQLGFGEQAVRPGSAFLGALPKGPPLTPISIPGEGERSQRPVSGVDPTVGTLMHVDGPSGTTWYVLLQGGLSEISPVEAAVITATSGRKSQPIRAAEANEARNAKIRYAGRTGMPAQLPRRSATPGIETASVCATWTEANQPPRVAFGVPTPPVDRRSNDPTLADVVLQPSLRGALVRHEGAVGPEDPGMLIVGGLRYGIANHDAKNALGYGEEVPADVPAQVLRLVREGLDPGQSLSVQAAQQQS